MRKFIARFGVFANFFLFVRCLDSALSALIPISIWCLFKNTAAFALLEYVNVFGVILSNFADAGFTFYGYFGYKHHVNPARFLQQYLSGFGFFSSLLMIAALIGLLAKPLVFLILARTLYLYAYRFFSIYFNLQDKMIWINVLSCGLSITTFCLFYLSFISGRGGYVWLYILPGFLVLTVLNIYLLYKNRKSLFAFVTILKPAMKFSWALTVNNTFTAVMANVAKFILYHQSNLEIMASFSLIQRIGGLIYLVHGVIASYRSKHLFLLNHRDLTAEFRHYGIKMFALTCSIIAGFWVVNVVFDLKLSNSIILALLFASSFNCMNSFLEMYFSRANRPHLVLVVTLIYSLAFYGILSLMSFSAMGLAFLMMGTSIFAVVMTLIFIQVLVRSRL